MANVKILVVDDDKEFVELTKPFPLNELLARIRAVRRRTLGMKTTWSPVPNPRIVASRSDKFSKSENDFRLSTR